MKCCFSLEACIQQVSKGKALSDNIPQGIIKFLILHGWRKRKSLTWGFTKQGQSRNAQYVSALLLMLSFPQKRDSKRGKVRNPSNGKTACDEARG